jgi:hypothetical protein
MTSPRVWCLRLYVIYNIYIYMYIYVSIHMYLYLLLQNASKIQTGIQIFKLAYMSVRRPLPHLMNNLRGLVPATGVA